MAGNQDLSEEAASRLLFRLLKSDSEAEVMLALREAGLWDDDASWRLYGDRAKNFSTAGNQQSNPDAALVEKIINSGDALLMRLCAEAGMDPRSPDAPKSIRQAVAMFFEDSPREKIRDYQGLIKHWSRDRRTEVARNIALSITGPTARDGRPSISIVDMGEGQSPEKLPHTILSLDEGLKETVPFVQGKFNMGGTGALRFCGQHNLQLVLSKRAPSLRGTDSDAWGFSIVRREPPTDTRSISIYRYLAPVGAPTSPRNGEVLRFHAATLSIFPEGQNAYSREAEWGTLIKLYEFDTRFKTHMFRRDGLQERLDLLIPGLALPVRLHECRAYGGAAGSFETTLAGLEVRLHDSSQSKTSNLEPEFPDSSSGIHVTGQRIGVTIYAFKKDAARTYRKGEGVLFVVNGQTHTSLSDAFFRRQNVGMGYLRDSLLVLLDCSHLDGATREDLFMNSRDRLAHAELERRIEDELADLVRNHQGLKALRERRRQEDTASKLSDSKPLEEILNEILRKSPSLAALFLPGSRLSNPFSTMEVRVGKAFEGKVHPTYFKFREHSYGETLIRTCHLGQRLRLTLETDVVNEYFKRDSNAGKLTITSELNGAEAELDYSYNLYNGLAHLNLTLPAQARRGDKLHLKIEVGDPTMLEPFVNEAELSVQAAQAVSTGQNGRRSSSSDETDHSDPVQRPSGISFPKITEVAREDWRPRHMDEFSALRIEQVEAQDESQGVPLYDFFVNVDNIHLKHEEKIAPADAAALKAQFLYGMVLIGLGILKQTFQPPKRTSGVAEAENTAQVLTDPEAVVAHATDAIAPMLLPMIHVLGGIDVEDLSNYVESPGEFLEV